jgi:hypothetical protein
MELLVHILKLISPVLTLIVLVWFLGFLKPSKQQIRDRKGMKGELRVHRELLKLGSGYHVFHNITLPSSDTKTKTTQIDHIVVSNKGVFVIETKNYQGTIVGKERDYYWRQVFRKSSRQFYSPMVQNELHISAIRDLLNESLLFPEIYSIIAFSDKANIRQVQTESRTKRVCSFQNLKQLIRTVQTITVLDEDVQSVANAIYEGHTKIVNKGGVSFGNEKSKPGAVGNYGTIGRS